MQDERNLKTVNLFPTILTVGKTVVFQKQHKSSDFYYTSSAAVLYFRDNSGFVFVQHATVFYYSEMFLVIVSISKLIHTASYGIYLFGLLIN